MDRELSSFKGKKLNTELSRNIELFVNIFSNNAVFRKREIISGENKYCVIFFDGMVSSDILNESVIKPLVLNGDVGHKNTADILSQSVLFADEINKVQDMGEMLSSVLYGDTIILIDKSSDALVVNTKGWRKRGITEPNDERVLQGPREGFDEALMANLSMLRRRLPTPDLAVESLKCGRKTETKMFLCYIESVVDKKTVETIKKRISKIDIDGILDSNYINELINENKLSMFKTIGTTEKPDIVAAKLLEGRVALMVDGTPSVITMPYIFVENFQSDDDYYLNFWYASCGRILRYICFFIAIFAPAAYVAVTVYNPQLIPTSFLLSVASSRGGIPFSTFLECIVLSLIFEILKETGIRMQQGIGQALSIVGGLVVGQSAVDAKIVSAPLLIVVAFSGIAGLMLPKLKTAVFYYKFFLIAAATLFGLFGLFIGTTVMFIHIYSLKSFGCDYTTPAETLSKNSMKDTLVRSPWRRMFTRPQKISQNYIRFRMKK